MIIHDSGRAALLNYIVALYDDNMTIEIRNNMKTQITDLETAMEVLGEIINIFKKAILDQKISTPDAIEAIHNEYEFLEIDKYLEYKYVGNIIILNLSLWGYYEHSSSQFYDMMFEIIENADKTANEILKIDLYCTMIRIISRYEVVTYLMDFARKLLDFYNSLPEENRKITILPEPLVAF